MHHFMRADLAASMAAIALYSFFLIAPGYVLGWLADLFEFRRRTAQFRFALSIPLSLCTVPILLYYCGRFASLAAGEAVVAATWIAFAVLLVRRGPRWPRLPRAAWWTVLGWLALALAVSVDLQIGTRDYYPVTAFDYSVRSEYIHSIGTVGIPPANPFFYPGHAVPLEYHYYWLLIPSLIYRGTGYALSARAAWIGGVFWCGLGLLCLVAVALRVFWNRGANDHARRAIAGALLLGVTGLDIVPTAFLWLLRAGGMEHAVLPSVEWWNEQVDGFTYTALWEAHHLAALIACVVAFLLLQEGGRQQPFMRQLVYAAVAGVALATAAGT